MPDDILTEFITLYEASPKIDRIKPQPANEEWLAFREKTGLPAAVSSTKAFLALLPHYESLYDFFRENDPFWLIPVDLQDGTIVGFLLRGFNKKDYRIYTQKGNPQLVCGFHTFGDFKGEPIILTEGLKDGLYLSKFYKYVISLLTDSPSQEMFEILSTITNKVILALDNDTAGEKQRKSLKNAFCKRGVQTQELVPKLKDWGKYFTNPSSTPILKIELTGVMSRFGIDITI